MISTRSAWRSGLQGHFEIGLAAIERRLPVFMEKPPAPTAAQARRLAHAAQQHGVPVVVGFMKRYSTANRIAANIVALGGIRRLGRASSAST